MCTARLKIEILFRSRFQQVYIQCLRVEERSLLQDIFDALEAGGDGFEVGRRANRFDALQARFEIDEIGPAGRHAGADFVVGEAANIAEVVFDAVAQKLAF